MIEGSCCCGAVKFALTAPPVSMGSCHCSRCRKLGDSISVFVRKGTLVWHQGRDQVAQYQPEAPFIYARNFCRICGSSLGEILSEAESFPIAASALDGDFGLTNQYHIFVADKPDWVAICDGAPQHAGMP